VLLVALVVFMLVWTGATLIIDAWSSRRRPNLAERLGPFRARWIEEEFEEWLRDR
jgi:uncharacterized membrane protein